MRTNRLFSVLTTVTLSTVLLFSVLFFSGCHHRTPEGRAELMIDCLAGRLDLDDSQKAYLSSVKDEMLAMRKDMTDSREAMKDELITQIKSDTFEIVELETLLEQKQVEMEKLVGVFKQRIVTFHATLSPEQKEKLADMIESFHGEHERHWH